MKLWRVVFDPDAEADLDGIHDWVARHANERIADGYAERLTSFRRRLRTFPERGEVRNDIHPGVRVIGFEERASGMFAIDENEVRILRILYAGRQFDGD